MKAKLLLLIVVSVFMSEVSVGQHTIISNYPAQFSFVYPIGINGRSSVDFCYYFSLNALNGHTGGIEGCEIGGLFNVNETSMTGFQVAGLGNVTKENVVGMQTGGLFCFSDSMTGFQLSGIYNKAAEMKGVQIAGIYNQTTVQHGLQIGLVNVADSVEKGVSIGLIYWVKKGSFHEWTVSVSDYQNIALSYKLGRKSFYNIYSAGVNFLSDFLWVGGLGFGHLSPLGPNFSFQPELICYTYFPSNFSRNTRDTYITHLKFGFVSNVNENLSISFAPSVYWSLKSNRGIYDEYGYNQSVINPLYEFETWDSNSKLGIGYGLSVGLGFK